MKKLKLIFKLWIVTLTTMISTNIPAALITSYSTSINPTQQSVSFSITYNSAPDFYTTDSVGRRADSFQFYVDEDGIVDYPYYDAIVNGVSPLIEGVTVNNPMPGESGWGPLVAVVPFTLTGSTVDFSVSWTDLRNSDGNFIYSLQTTHYGGQDQWFSSNLSGVDYTVSQPPYTPSPASVPVPAAGWLLGSGLLSLIAVARRRKRA